MPSNKKLLQAAAGSAGGDPLYVEDVFSTYLYEGTGSGIAINNGIDLSGEGGLVVYRRRDGAENWSYQDTERGVDSVIYSDSTNAAANPGGYGLASFNSNGFTTELNTSGADYASWTFRKAEKFFDVVTYTGDGVSGRTVAHNLGVAPAVMLIKRTSASGDDWAVYHSSLGATKLLALNTNGAQVTNPWLTNTAPTDSVFTLNNYGFINASGSSYVAYLFASDAGGFGDDGDENIIKCGTFSGTGQVDLGFEPQWVLTKPYTQAYDWEVADIMRRFDATSSSVLKIEPNTSNAEAAGPDLKINATGFNNQTFGTSYPCIYIAIRRPMKTPEAGTEVFSPNIWTGDGTANRVRSLPLTPDLAIGYRRDGTYKGHLIDRLRGKTALVVNNTSADAGPYAGIELVGANSNNTSILDASDGGSTGYNINGWNYVAHYFKRATGFMDMVAYTGNGGTSTQAHNLGVVPELMIFKRRNSSGAWNTYVASSVLSSAGPTKFLELNDTASIATDNNFINGAPTSSLINTGSNTNQNGDTYIAYLFATLDGVSKVGSYTGTGSDLNVDCGFSAGARFILIKRSDAINDWYVWDSARGIVAGNDPYILVNSTASEVTNTDYIDPLASGFTVTSSASSTVNVSSGTYIFLAIA